MTFWIELSAVRKLTLVQGATRLQRVVTKWRPIDSVCQIWALVSFAVSKRNVVLYLCWDRLLTRFFFSRGLLPFLPVVPHC